MQFGFFDDINKEYVITTPETPLPWINYLGCENFFSLKPRDRAWLYLFRCGIPDGGGCHLRILFPVCQSVHLQIY